MVGLSTLDRYADISILSYVFFPCYLRHRAIEGIGITRSKILDEKQDAMSRAEQEIKPQGIINSPLGRYAGNGFGKHGESQTKELFPQERRYAFCAGDQNPAFSRCLYFLFLSDTSFRAETVMMKFSGCRSGSFSSSSTKTVIAFRMKAGKCIPFGNARILCRVFSSIVAVYFANFLLLTFMNDKTPVIRQSYESFKGYYINVTQKAILTQNTIDDKHICLPHNFITVFVR